MERGSAGTRALRHPQGFAFDESFNAAFIFLSPGNRGRLQKSLVFCRFQSCRFAPVLLPAARGDGDLARQSSVASSGFFLLSKIGLAVEMKS